jgi:YfiH family protein
MKEKSRGINLEPFVQTSESFLSIKDWNERHPDLLAGFTAKNGGVSEFPFQSMNTAFHVNDMDKKVRENRRILANQIHFPVETWIGAEQTHESTIRKIDKEHAGLGSMDYQTALKATDGLYTKENGLLLTLCFADCVPVYFIAPTHHLVGIVHAGWKGTVAGISSSMVRIWEQAEGVQPNEIYAAIGPSICQNCYTVDKKVINLLEVILEEQTKTAYNQITENKYQLDLKIANALILQKAGILPENIMTTNFCTSCDDSYFFSHRRDQGKTGRMMGLIGWKEE